MEKIYMGDKNSPQRQVNNKYRFSIILSFIVAVFAIVSLIAIGFNQVSYAAPDGTGDDSGEAAKLKVAPYRIKDTDKSLFISSIDANNKAFYYELMYEDTGNLNYDSSGVGDISNINILFCYDNQNDDAGYGDSDIYSDGGIINDAGLIYILNRSGITGSGVNVGISGLSAGSENYRYLEAYATQIAIWEYLNRTGIENIGPDESNLKPISSIDPVIAPIKYQLYAPTVDYSKDIFNGSIHSGISKVVNEARNISSTGSGVEAAMTDINIIISDPDHVSKVDGTNYYQSSKISVSAPDLIKYSLDISGVEGAFVVDVNGEEIKNLNDLPASTEFFIRFPQDKIKEKVDFVIKATGEAKNTLSPHKYLLEGKQSIIKVEKGTGPVAGQKTWTVVASPDTGSSTSQTIYFIGLIVLLCGVGIIYANSKAVKDA